MTVDMTRLKALTEKAQVDDALTDEELIEMFTLIVQLVTEKPPVEQVKQEVIALWSNTATTWPEMNKALNRLIAIARTDLWYPL